MKQSLKLQTPKNMPRFNEELQDARTYIFPREEGKASPKDSQRALRAFFKPYEARQWAKNNLDYYTLASRQ